MDMKWWPRPIRAAIIRAGPMVVGLLVIAISCGAPTPEAASPESGPPPSPLALPPAVAAGSDVARFRAGDSGCIDAHSDECRAAPACFDDSSAAHGSAA